ncbi:MAG: S9 family peptidase [Prochloraceae cyanobacterium]
MTKMQITSFGSWRSPITSDLIVSKTIKLKEILTDDRDIYWLEGRPNEGGRSVVVKLDREGVAIDLTPEPFNVRSRVHEYGGGAYTVANGIVYFTNFSDRRIYKQVGNSFPQPITPEDNKRYADLTIDPHRNRLICICEDHSHPETEPENSLVSIDLDSETITVLASGEDFYSSPRLSEDGNQLAYISWNHPNLPWDSSKLWLINLQSNETKCIAGEREEESICEPKWSSDGILYFSSDRNGWWNLYRLDRSEQIELVFQLDAEFAYPHWIFGLSNYSFVDNTTIVCSYTEKGRWYLGTIDTEKKQLEKLDLPYSDIESVKTSGNNILFIGGSSTIPTAIVRLDLTTKTTTILKQSSETEIDPGYISTPEAIEFPTANGKTAYAWYYPPKNKDYSQPTGELPPLLVKSHGGPTAAASVNFNLRIQYWTSRGFGYLDVNYGGSTGYGRKYRQRLDRNWGIVDVDDCVNAAKYLVKQKKADPDRLAISGGSAGGYTTIAALTFKDTFKAGASYYGIGDLEILARDTHKFESRYLDRLVGKYPEEKQIYIDRSPIHFTSQLAVPVIFFQGLEDKVVPPNQAEMMVKAIENKGIPVAYVTFANEGHGFRRAENIKTALDGEFYFYSRIFNFQPAEDLPSVNILNLE